MLVYDVDIFSKGRGLQAHTQVCQSGKIKAVIESLGSMKWQSVL